MKDQIIQFNNLNEREPMEPALVTLYSANGDTIAEWNNCTDLEWNSNVVSFIYNSYMRIYVSGTVVVERRVKE